MIVLDEQIHGGRIRRAVERWYPGKVISIVETRPQTRILDPVIPTLLRRLKDPTFVTINYKDFWRRIEASLAYCVVCFQLPPEHSEELPEV